MACHYSNILFRRLGCKVASINDTVGIHSRNPNPTVDEYEGIEGASPVQFS